MRNRAKSNAQRHTDKTIAAAVGAVVGATTGGGKRLGGVGISGTPAQAFTTAAENEDGTIYTQFTALTEVDSTNTDGPMTG